MATTTDAVPLAPATRAGVGAVYGLTLLVALGAVAGSLALSMILQLKACPLCFYQRTFVMGVVAILLVGLLAGVRPLGRLAVLALPLALAGLGVAGFHVYLELSGVLECPKGLYGLGTAPQQSLAAYSVLTLLLLVLLAMEMASLHAGWALGVGVLLSVGFAVGCIKSSPPLPKAPSKPYETPLDICRPPFRSP